MTSRKLLILGVVAIAVVGAGVWLTGRQSDSGAEKSQALYPALKGELNSVTAVRIFKPGDERAVEIARKGGEGGKDATWVVTERADYPADESKLRKLLLGVADAKVYEEKTSNPASYSALGVQDTSDKGAGGFRIELEGVSKPVNLIVGKQGAGMQSQYVRRAGEPQSWLINASIDNSSSPDAWLRKDLIDISADRIQSAAVGQGAATAKAYTAAKGSRADANFAVQGLPKGKQISSESAANSLATALTGVTLADVQPAAAFESTTPDSHATFRTFDGLVAQVQGWKRNDKHYVAVQTSFDAAQAERFKVATAPAAKSDDKKATDKAAKQDPPQADAAALADAAKTAQPNIDEEAKRDNAKLDGWVYEIPEYKYEAIFKPMEQLLKTAGSASAAK